MLRNIVCECGHSFNSNKKLSQLKCKKCNASILEVYKNRIGSKKTKKKVSSTKEL